MAKAQIIPWFESITMLDNQLETAQESKVILTTEKEHFQEIAKMIRQNSSYDVPEITVLEIQDGNAEYLQWLKESRALEKKNSTQKATKWQNSREATTCASRR